MKNTLMNFAEYCEDEHGLPIPSWMIDNYLKSMQPSATAEEKVAIHSELSAKIDKILEDFFHEKIDLLNVRGQLLLLCSPLYAQQPRAAADGGRSEELFCETCGTPNQAVEQGRCSRCWTSDSI